jgi:N-acetylglutamate synthase-like GNAT family acetyltransferase
MQIIQYQPEHRDAVLALLHINTPMYFAPEEEADFIRYLDHEIDDYYVIEMDGQIVGCGGINVKHDGKTGVLSWDIINPDIQGKGLGSRLVKFRIDRLFDTYHVNNVIVRTTQFVYPFYEKMGFTVVATEKDYWAKGYDLYYMQLRIE